MNRVVYAFAIAAFLATLGLGLKAVGVPRLDAIQPASVRVGSAVSTQTSTRRGGGGILFVGGGVGRSGRYSGGGGFGFGGK